MRVICIDSKLHSNETKNYGIFKPIEGDVYTVIKETVAFDNKDKPVVCYVFLEDSERLLHNKIKFIPCSEIDELELINEKELTN